MAEEVVTPTEDVDEIIKEAEQEIKEETKEEKPDKYNKYMSMTEEELEHDKQLEQDLGWETE